MMCAGAKHCLSQLMVTTHKDFMFSLYYYRISPYLTFKIMAHKIWETSLHAKFVIMDYHCKNSHYFPQILINCTLKPWQISYVCQSHFCITYTAHIGSITEQQDARKNRYLKFCISFTKLCFKKN